MNQRGGEEVRGIRVSGQEFVSMPGYPEQPSRLPHNRGLTFNACPEQTECVEGFNLQREKIVQSSVFRVQREIRLRFTSGIKLKNADSKADK